MNIPSHCIGDKFYSANTFKMRKKTELIIMLQKAESNYQKIRNVNNDLNLRLGLKDPTQFYNRRELEAETQKKKIQKLGKLCVQNDITEHEIFRIIQERKALEDKGWTD